MSTHSSLHTLKGTLRGELIEPGDSGYDEARKVYNGMISKRPLAIAKCADVADVVACVQAGVDRGIPVAIRGGGHNAGGLGICDDGLVIDMARMNRVQVDAQSHTVRVGGGALWQHVDKATHEFGQATPSGIISTTGVGGLSLGGGIGHLTRKCGLTIDNILGAEMVLADGETATVNADAQPRSVLGDPRRRRQLRRRHRVHLPHARHPHRLSRGPRCGRSIARRRSCSGIASSCPRNPMS